ncbi:MAG: hypothetical protein ACRDSL_14795 [Pseudonocardiaceae bacterium]
MMLDAQADPGRRVWLPCPHCGDNTGLYFLDYDINFVWVQCGSCLRRWWHDTGFGRGGNPYCLSVFDAA